MRNASDGLISFPDRQKKGVSAPEGLHDLLVKCIDGFNCLSVRLNRKHSFEILIPFLKVVGAFLGVVMMKVTCALFSSSFCLTVVDVVLTAACEVGSALFYSDRLVSFYRLGLVLLLRSSVLSMALRQLVKCLPKDQVRGLNVFVLDF